MKLIIAIVQDEFTNKVVKSLMDNKIRITKLSSTGGFLKAGNTTLFIGVEDEQVDDVVGLIKKEIGNKKVDSGDENIRVGGANLFVMDIDSFIKF